MSARKGPEGEPGGSSYFYTLRPINGRVMDKEGLSLVRDALLDNEHPVVDGAISKKPLEPTIEGGIELVDKLEPEDRDNIRALGFSAFDGCGFLPRKAA